MKKLTAMLIVISMMLAMLPAGLFAFAVSGTEATIEKLDTTTVSVSDMQNSSFNKPGNWWAEAGVRYKVKDSGNSWTTAVSGNVTLTHGTTYEVQEIYTQLINTQYSDSYYVTFKLYHNVTASVDASANAEGAGKVTATGKVYHNEKATITVTDVDGYKAELYNGTTKVTTLSDTAGWTYTIDKATASVAYTVKYVSEAATEYNVSLNVVNGEWGTATLGTDKGIAGAEIGLTITPKATDSATYTPNVVVTNGSYDKSTGKVTVAGTGDVVVTVTFSKSELEVNSNPTLEINGYDTDSKFADIKKNILNAVLKGGYTNIEDYNLHIFLSNPVGTSNNVWFDWDNTNIISLTGQNALKASASRFPDDNFGTDGKADLKVKIIDKDGRTVESTIAVTEARKPATVTPPSALNGTFNTKELFMEALLDSTIAYDNNNAPITVANSGLTLTPTWNGNQCTVTWEVTKDGATWLAASGNLGTYTWTISVYKVTFVNDDGSLISEKEYPYGTTTDNITLPEMPSKADKKDEYGNVMATYTFKGWDPTVDTVTKAITYTATYTEVAKEYTISWDIDGDGDVDTTTSVAYGEVPTAPSASKAANNTYTYNFTGWDKEIVAVTGEATYTAQFTPVYIEYTVRFENWNGDEISEETYHYGDTIVVPDDPTRPATAQYTYTFIGWNKTVSETCNGTVTYNATYSSTVNKYTVTFENWDGTVLQSGEWDYGSTPEYTGATPTRAADGTYTYTFWKWNPEEIATVTGDATYTAVYTTTNLYNYTIDVVGGTVPAGTVLEDLVEEGTKITLPTPTKTGYTFKGWNVNGTVTNATEITISGETTITAVWEINQYTITFVDYNDEEIATLTQDYGTAVTAPADPTRVGHTFTGWDAVVPATMPAKNMTIKAVYDINVYTITWVVDGVETTETYTYGSVPSFTGSTDKAADAQYTYTFTDWDKEIVAATEDATYTAQYSKTVNKYTVTWIVDGKTTTETYEYGTVPSYKGSTDKATANYIKYTFTGWDATPVAVTGNVTYTAQYSAELLASNGSFTMNGYYESKGNMDEIIKTLKSDVLAAAGITGNASNYTVTMKYSLGTLDLDKLSGWANALNATAFFTAIELPETARQFTITDKSTGVSKTVTMKITDSRPVLGNTNLTVSEQKDLGYMTNDNILADIKAVVGNLELGTPALSAGSLPTNAGDLTSVTYTVSFAGDATYQAATITITYEKVYKSYNDCTVSADSNLTANGSLTINGGANATVPGNSTVTITVTPSDNNVVETITVYKNGEAFATYTTDKISYNNKAATVSFKSDGSTKADEYVVSATYSQNYLNLKADQTIVYCVDDKDHTYDLQKLVFDAIFGGSSAPMTKDNVKLEFKYGHVVVDLWADVSKDPAINLNGISHKFGESGSETIKLTYSDAKYGSFEQQIALNVFDSCYNVEVDVQTITNGANATIKTQFSADARKYLGVDYFKAGTSLTVTLTPDGAFLDTLKQMYNGTYAESMAYIKFVRVYERGNETPLANIEVVRGQGKLSLEGILQGVNPMLHNAAVTFTLENDKDYFVVAEYGILELDAKNSGFQMEMYKGGSDYAAKVPSAQDFVNAILGEDEAAAFLATYGGAFTVDFSTSLIDYSWTAVSDEALLALNDGTEIKVRITWKPTDGDKTYYPVADTSNVTLVDLRTPTSVQGTVPTDKVEYVEESQLIAELKEALGLGILANGSPINVAYTVTYTITGDETNGFYATVTVTYDGSAAYKPTSKTFDNVPVADIPDNATIKVTIQNASDVITNNDGKIQSLDPATGIYTVIGNGTYTFKFTPVSGKAIESVTVNGVKVDITYNKGVVTFSMVLTEKEHYEVVVETVDSVFDWNNKVWNDLGTEFYVVYNFAYGVNTATTSAMAGALIASPGDINFDNVKIEYLAREEGKVPVTLPNIDLGFTVIELGSFDVELGELWLAPDAEVTEYDMEKLLDELVAEVIDKVSHGELAATDAVSYMTEKLKGLTIGAHVFGAGGDGSFETIRASYSDDKYVIAETVVNVQIHDYRTATEIVANDCTVTYGYSLEQLLAASGAYVSADGAKVDGLTIGTNDLYLHANTAAQQITLTFAGDVDYQPSSVTINVTVNKAPVSIDYDSQFITYGDAYDLGLVVSPTTMPDGTDAKVDRIEMMIGMDMHKLLDVDFGSTDAEGNVDKTVGLDQAIAYIQLRLPESIRNLPLVGQYLQGEFTLGEFTDLINSLSGSLGIDAGSMETLNKVIEAITGVTDNMEIKVIIKDEDFHPTNIGVYIAGAVTVDADFETAYTADYLIIAPKTIEAELGWDYTDDNMIMTLPAYQNTFKDLMGAHVIENETMTGDTLTTANGHIKYLILGVNDETSEFLTTDIYGNIKANIWTSNDSITDNGVYVQIAYMLNWGNEIYYAMPIVRTFIITPEIANVELRGDSHEENNELHKVFDNTGKGFNVLVTDAAGNELVYTYGGNESEWLTVHYVGIQTNGKVYNSTEKPVHAGIYTATAIYAEYDEDGNLVRAGMAVGMLVIEPADSTVEVEDKIEIVDPDKSYNPKDQVTAGSTTVPGLTPDTTIITAGIASNGTFTENGWNAINGNVNVDFPKWVDELLAKYAPSIVDGITVSELSDKLAAKLPEILSALEEKGATTEVLNALTNAVNNVVSVLDEMPDNTTVSFSDDVAYTNVGAYVIVAVVTDSDHYPSADAGLLVITPDFTQVKLEWNYVDENGVFTRDLLEAIDYDLWAKAFDVESGLFNEAATNKITYQFIGINSDGDLVVYTDPTTLPNGAYIEVAYIEFELDGKIYISDMIARPVVIVASNCNVEIENLETVFDNTEKDVTVNVTDLEGNAIDATKGEMTFLYAGLQTNGQAYLSDKAPVHAGVYEVIVTFVLYDENGELRYYGANVGYVVIKPTDSTIDVTGGNVKYDGNGHTATVTPGSTVSGLKPDFTLISGGAWITGNADSVGLDALHGNVNIDFPKWLDEVLASTEAFQEGVSPAYLIDFINSYRDDLVDLIPVDTLTAAGASEAEIEAAIEKLNAYIDELLSVLEKMPADVTLTFKDNVTYTMPGYYFYYGIVTDSDHYPTTDTGLLVIEKLDIDFDLENTTLPYNGNEQFVNSNNPLNTDFFAIITNDRNNTANILVDADMMYVIDLVERILGKEIPTTVDVANVYAKVDVAELTAAINEILAAVEQYDLPAIAVEMIEWLKAQLATLPTTGTVTVNGKLPVDAGEYKIYAITYSEIYKSVVDGAVLTIAPIYVVVDDVENGKIYGQTDPELTANVTYYSYQTINGVVTKVAITELPEGFQLQYIVVREDGEDVGEYGMSVDSATVNDNVNYVVEIVEDDTVFTITPAEITSVDATDTVYNGTEQTTTLTVIGVNGEALTEGVDFVIVSGNKATNAGVYTVTIKGIGNYTGEYTAQWTIAKANVTVTINSDTITYGTKTPAVTLTYSDELAKSEVIYNLSWNAPEYANVGTYAINFVYQTFPNWNVTMVGGSLTVVPAASITVDATDTVYNGTEQTTTLTVNGVNGEALTEGVDFVIVSGNKATNAGVYTVTIKGIGNYTGEYTAQWTIAKATVTVTVQNAEVFYGNDIPAVELVYSDALAESELNLQFVWSAVKGSNVGTYGTNFTWVRYENWNVNYVPGELTIKPATVTITVYDQSKVYGNADPELTYDWFVTNGSVTADELGIVISRVAGENVGEYTITATYNASNNYVVTVEDGTLTITTKSITAADVALDGALTYTGNEQTQNITVTNGITYTVSGNTATNADTYTLTVTGTGNYSGTVEVEWTIAKAKVTVTILDNTVVYGEDIPAVELQYTNELARRELNLQFVWSAVKGSNVGTYGTNFTWINYQNWIVNYVPGELTITPRDVTVTVGDATMVATNKLPDLNDINVVISGLYGSDTLSYTLKHTTDGMTAGSYAIVAEYVANPNYNVTVVDGTLTVEQCVLTVDGVAFNSWADAGSSIKKNSQIKLYADVEYGVDENGKKVEHKFPANGGSIVIDLNGFDLTFHHTVTVQFSTVLTVTDTSGNPGTLVTTYSSYPFAINGKSTLNLVNGVGFDGTMQFQNLANGNKAYFQINGENIIGTDNSLFVCDTTTVRLTLKDQYMTLGLLMGHLTLTQNLETLALQEITIASGTGITIPAGVILTLNPTTNVTIKGTVDGEGTIKVGTKTHLDQVLTETAITNIAIAEGIVIDSYTLDRADINYTGAINLIGTGVVITAGTFDADVYAICADGYWAKNNGDGTWTVLKKIEIGSVVIGDKLTYNGTAQNPTNITVYDVNGNVVASENYNVFVTSQTNAGTYVLTVEAKVGNYGFFGSAEANWTIAKKAATITANDKTMVAGNTIPTLDATVEGVVDGETLNYTLSTDYVSAIGNHDTYKIVVTLGENPNYDVTVVDGTLTVEQCVLTVNGVAYSSWADAKATIDVNTSWNKTCEIVLYADVDSDNNGFNPNGSITVDLNGNTWTSHWMGISYNTVVNVINSSDKTGNVLVTRSDNRVVLGANSVFNLNGNIAFDGTIQLNNGAQNTTGYFQINGENIIGEKDSLFVDSGNSTVRVIMKDSFMSINLIYGRLTLTEDLATLAGQEIILASGTSITIPENVELTLDADTVITINGTVDGEGTVVVNSFEHLQQVLSETTVANIKLGSDINVIARALATATVEAGRTVTLDLNGKTLNAKLAVNGNLTIVDSTVTGTTAQDYMAAGSVLGDVTVNGTLVLNAGNYSKDMDTYCARGLVTIKTAEGVYTVMPPQEFSATLNNETHIYNGNVQTQGFVATDAFGNTLVEGTDFTVTGNTATTAGSHTITIKGTGDYTGTVTLEWTIAKATVTVTVNSVTITYGEKTPAVTLTYSDELAKTEVIYNLSWNAPEYANVGTYTINIVYQTFPNWNVTLLGGSLTVIPKDVTITADNKSMVAGNTVPELTATVVGAVDGETLNYTLSVDTDGKTVGTFDIVVTLGENPNYNVTVVNGTLTVETAIARNTNTGVNYAKLADAIAEVQSDETIVFLTDIDEDVTIKQVKNVQFTIDGANYKYFGTMTVNGTGYAGAQGQALTIKNVNFVVDGVAIDINVKRNYARNITVESCTFTGEGYNDYGMRLHSVYNIVVKNTTANGMFDLVYGRGAVTGFTAENVEVINSTNGIVLSYVNSTATFKNVNTSVTEAGVIIRNNAKGTVNFEECGIDSIVYYATDANTASVTMNFIDTTNNLVIDGASDKLTIVLNKVDTTVTAIDGLKATTTVDGYRVAYEDGKYFLVEIDYVAQIGDTKYESIQEAVDAAQDGDTIVILKDHVIGATVQTEANFGYESVIIVDGKNVTIDFAGHTVTVKHGDAANYAGGFASCLEAVVFIYDNAGLTLMDSTGDNGGFYVPADENVEIYSMFYNCGGELTINSGVYNIVKGHKSASIIYAEDEHDSAVTGGNFTMGNAGENSNTKPWIFNTEGKNATFVYISGGTYNQNPYLNYGTQKDCEAKLVEGYCIKNNGDGTWTVLPHSYTAVVTAPTCTEGGYTTYTCDCGHSYVADYTEVIGHVGGTPIYVIESQVTCTTNGIMHVITSCTECGHEISRDTIVTPAKGHVAGAPVQENYVAPTVDAEGGYDMVTYCGVCGEELSSVHHTIAKLEPVAKNTATGKIYATLAAAIKAATAGDTIVLLANVTEDVTVSKDITIDGDNWQYTGNISVSGTATDATVKNVNFVNGTGYAITTNRIKSITVENCTVKNYGYGFLYANKTTPTVVVKDVTVEDATLGINWVYGTTATLENVVMNNVPYGLQIHNYAGKTINLKNCDITSIVVYERDGASGVQTFKFYGDNTVDTLTGSQYAKYVLAEVDATLTAPADFAVASGVAGYEVAYENGKYFLTAIVYDYVAQNITTGVSYESLQEAIDAAQNGETIVLLKDIELTTAETIKNSGEYATIFNVADKAITIDLNGYDITVDASAADLADEKSSMLMGVFTVDTNGTLTLKDSVGTGSVEVSANDAIVYSLVTCYGNGGKLNIESGSYTADKVDSALIYSQYDEVIIVSGGNFHLGNVGTGDNGSPWIFNAKGQNTQNIIVIGGTFNADVFHQYYIFEVKDAVEVAELLGVPVKACKNNGDGTWTIVDAVAYVAEQHKSGNWYTQNVGYATFAEAYAAADEGEKITILANVTVDFDLTKNVVVYKGSNTVTFAEGAEVYAGTFDWNVNDDCAIGYYAKDNGDGTWTVEKRKDVAYNVNDDVYYTDVSDALMAATSGETVILLVDDQTEAMLMVPAGVTFNLNGHTITAGNVFSFGNVIDNNGETDGLGGIKISNDKTQAFTQLQQNNTYLPLYDAANGCYRFYAYTVGLLSLKTPLSNAVTFRFRLRLSSAEAYRLLADTANSGVELSVNVSWTGVTASNVKYVVTGEFLQEYAEGAYQQVVSGQKTAMTVNKTIEFSLSGLDALESGSVITATPTFTSTATGVVAERTDKVDGYTSYTYTAPAADAE